jgi:hypothetical protein
MPPGEYLPSRVVIGAGDSRGIVNPETEHFDVRRPKHERDGQSAVPFAFAHVSGWSGLLQIFSEMYQLGSS